MGTVNTKICSQCGEEKFLTIKFFQWRTDREKWRNKCKECIKLQKQEHNKKNAKRKRI